MSGFFSDSYQFLNMLCTYFSQFSEYDDRKSINAYVCVCAHVQKEPLWSLIRSITSKRDFQIESFYFINTILWLSLDYLQLLWLSVSFQNLRYVRIAWVPLESGLGSIYWICSILSKYLYMCVCALTHSVMSDSL